MRARDQGSRNPTHLLVGTHMGQPLWTANCQFLTKLSTLFTLRSAGMLLGICPKELETYVHPNTRTWTFKVALFVIAKT